MKKFLSNNSWWFYFVLTYMISRPIWALWHSPIYLLEGWGGNDQPFILLFVYCIPLSMILTWLYYKSRKNIIPVEPSETWLNNQYQTEKLMNATGLKGITFIF